jgi:hypothetical protein
MINVQYLARESVLRRAGWSLLFVDKAYFLRFLRVGGVVCLLGRVTVTLELEAGEIILVAIIVAQSMVVQLVTVAAAIVPVVIMERMVARVVKTICMLEIVGEETSVGVYSF